jgi:salicylate hydroxylase
MGARTAQAGSCAIVGAGLGGLTAALALIKQGWRVRVYEQAPVLGEVGAGLTLSPGAGRGLASLGLESQILVASLPVPDIAFLHYATGEVLAGEIHRESPVDQGLAQPRHIHRADLHGLLVAAVRQIDPDAVVCGKRLLDLDDTGAGASLRFADGAVAQADLAIGADGARSVVRRALFDDDAPQFAGQIAFRCLINRAEAEPYLNAGRAAVFIGSSRVFNRYLIRGGEVVNVIGIAKAAAWSAEGWNNPASVDDFLEAFEGFHPDVLGLIARSPTEAMIKWGLFTRPPLAVWSKGRATLLGDAAHPILPFLGLGAALAIEDGLVLARALAQAPDLAEAFDAFQQARTARVEEVRTRTQHQGEIIQAAEPDRASLTRSPSQQPRLFDYDPTFAPISV